MKRQPKEKDPKITTTRIIWSFATGMMAICIPLVALSRSGVILPLAVILGSSASTVAVWRNQDGQKLKSSNFRAIEQRVIDLETICSSQDLDVAKKFQHLESKEIAQAEKKEPENL